MTNFNCNLITQYLNFFMNFFIIYLYWFIYNYSISIIFWVEKTINSFGSYFYFININKFLQFKINIYF